MALASCSPTTGERARMNEAPDAEAGARLYASVCASCHGAEARGDGPEAERLAARPADLTLLAYDHGGQFPRTLVVDTVAGRNVVDDHGSREMPVWRDAFTVRSGERRAGVGGVGSLYQSRRMEQLVAYLESLQRTP